MRSQFGFPVCSVFLLAALWTATVLADTTAAIPFPVCPPGSPQCLVFPCHPRFASCPAFPEARCIAQCDCTAKFVDKRGNEVDCEGGSGDVCSLPKVVGPCEAAIRSWFFNKDTGKCEFFFFGGCDGNGNRFDSKDECEEQCAPKPVDVCSLPADPGPCEALGVQWFFNKKSGECQPFNYGGCRGNANRFPTRAACQNRCVCDLPKKVGPCKAAIKRYYFNSKTGRCQRFIWGGCQPNENNFETLDECKGACVVDPCTLPKKVGPCKALIPRYFFNTATKMCEKFSWGGCQPNGNNFETEALCQASCTGLPVFLPATKG